MTNPIPVQGLSEELRPCPFCGAKPCSIPQNTSFERKDRKGFTVRVWCENCDVLGPERDTDAAAIEGWNRRAALVTELQHSREAEAGALNVRDEIVTRILDLSVVGKALSGFTDVEGDIFADELRGIVTNAIADTPAPRVVEQCLAIIDQMEMEWRAKGWDDEAAAACDIAARIKATPRAASPSSPASGVRVKPTFAELKRDAENAVDALAAYAHNNEALEDACGESAKAMDAATWNRVKAEQALSAIRDMSFKSAPLALSALGEHP